MVNGRLKRGLRVAFYVVASAVVILLLLLYYLAVWHVPTPTVYRLAGDAEEMGAQFGSQAGLETRLLLRFYIRDLVCTGNDQVMAASSTEAESYSKTWKSDYQVELSAMATSADVNRAELAFANMFLDMKPVRGGCRSAVLQTEKWFLSLPQSGLGYPWWLCRMDHCHCA